MTKDGAYLTILGLGVRLGGQDILQDVSLEVARGEFICLLGPSGCGKTTLLRAIAGFAPVAAGRIALETQDITTLAPERREAAMVFQSYALWPHMTVAGNLGFPLALRGIGRAERARRVAAMLAMLGLDGLGSRSVAQLSGGQRQRVALGRALIIDPPLLLLDEPLSNLDAAIRRTLRAELRGLQRRLGVTTLMVTHDQEEAFAMADRVAVLRGGKLVQIDSPQRLYDAPADREIAGFLGVDNWLQDGRIGFRAQAAQVLAAQPVLGFVRGGTVTGCDYQGGAWRVTLDVNGDSAAGQAAAPIDIGTRAWLSAPDRALMRFGADGRLQPATARPPLSTEQREYA